MTIEERNEVVNSLVNILGPLTTEERNEVLEDLRVYRSHWFQSPGAAVAAQRKTRGGWPKGTPRKPKVVIEPDEPEVDEDNPHGARCATCGELLCGDPLICIDCDDHKNFGDACEAFYKRGAQ